MNHTSLDPEPAALYVHVPFCSVKCGYCSFHSVPVRSQNPDLVSGVLMAALSRARDLSERFSVPEYSTAYVGGGTPTALPFARLRGLLAGMAELGGSRGFREWTVEANPESLNADTLAMLADIGVTRISLGVQSREEQARASVGRNVSTEQIERALGLLAGVWKGRLSVDLMSGLPGQTPRGLRSDILDMTAAGATHLSVYDLTLEDGTPLAARVRRGEIRLPDENESLALWDAVREGCTEAGLTRYEVSNWSRPGAVCLHNLRYWKNGSWVGVGPSAVSSFPLRGGGTLRIEEGRDHGAYVRDAGAEARETRIPPATAAFETVMMAFRTRDGLDARAFKERFGVSPEDVMGGTLEKWRDYIVPGPSGPAPTDRLLDILNRFLLDCLEEMERVAPGRLDSEGGFS